MEFIYIEMHIDFWQTERLVSRALKRGFDMMLVPPDTLAKDKLIITGPRAEWDDFWTNEVAGKFDCKGTWIASSDHNFIMNLFKAA